MILSKTNFTEYQFADEKSPVLNKFNNLMYYEFNELKSDLPADKQLNAKGNPTKEPCNNYVKYYVSATGTLCWDGLKQTRTVTGTVVDEHEIFTIPKYNYPTENLNTWLDNISKSIIQNNGSMLAGSDSLHVDDTKTTAKYCFYLPHDSDFMSKYFTSFPEKNILLPTSIENGIIDGMYMPVYGRTCLNYDGLSRNMSVELTSNQSIYVNPDTQNLLYVNFENQDVLNQEALNNLDNLENKPYNCNFFASNYFRSLATPWYVDNDYMYYKPLLGYPIYFISCNKIKNCRRGVDDKLAESDTWAVIIVKTEMGFLTK